MADAFCGESDWIHCSRPFAEEHVEKFRRKDGLTPVPGFGARQRPGNRTCACFLFMNFSSFEPPLAGMPACPGHSLPLSRFWCSGRDWAFFPTLYALASIAVPLASFLL
jgi:hypothetical protein